MSDSSRCPECGGGSLYRTTVGSGPVGGAANGIMFDLLPELGTFFSYAKMDSVVCRDCGLLRFYVSPESRNRLDEAQGWTRQ